MSSVLPGRPRAASEPPASRLHKGAAAAAACGGRAAVSTGNPVGTSAAAREGAHKLHNADCVGLHGGRRNNRSATPQHHQTAGSTCWWHVLQAAQHRQDSQTMVRHAHLLGVYGALPCLMPVTSSIKPSNVICVTMGVAGSTSRSSSTARWMRQAAAAAAGRGASRRMRTAISITALAAGPLPWCSGTSNSSRDGTSPHERAAAAALLVSGREHARPHSP